MNFRNMIEPMHPLDRLLRLAFLCGFLGYGYWYSGWTGVWAMFAIFTFLYWIWYLVSEGYKALKRDFGNDGRATFQIDQKVLNMNVEKGTAIKGTPFDFTEHRDPTRPSREISP